MFGPHVRRDLRYIRISDARNANLGVKMQSMSARRLSRTERYLGKRLSPRAKLEPFEKKPD